MCRGFFWGAGAQGGRSVYFLTTGPSEGVGAHWHEPGAVLMEGLWVGVQP